VPKGNALEASIVKGLTVYGASDLAEVVRFFDGVGDLVQVKNKIKRGGDASARIIRISRKFVVNTRSNGRSKLRQPVVITPY